MDTLCVVPIRATKRGDERTPLDGSHDVLICGASFAGLAVARELAGSGADVLVVDRYEIGERQTSACGIPTEWLRAMGLMESERQRFDSLLIHTPHGDARYRLPWTFSTFDYRELCELLWRDCDARFETAKVNGRARPANGDGAIAIETDRGVISRAARRRRARLAPDARLRRRLPAARRAALARARGPPGRRAARTSRSGSTAATCPPATAGPSRPATSCGSASAPSTRASTSARRPSCWPRTSARDRVRYQGNWIPHKLRRATEGGVFFAGDSAGHCLPLTAEGIRTALYFGIALGRELRGVVEGWQDREQAAARYAEFNDSHEWKFRWMLRVQRLVPQDPAAPAGAADPAARRQALRRLVLRPLPADRAAGVRRAAQRTIRTVPASSRATPTTRSGLSGTWSRPNRPEPVDHDRGGELAGDRRRRHPAGADRGDRDQRVGDVDGAEQAAEQVVPADVEGRAEPAGLAAEDDDRGERDRADAEGDERRRQAAGRLAEAGVDRRLQGDQAAGDGGEQDRQAPIHGVRLRSAA